MEELERRVSNIAKKRVYYSQECIQESLRVYKIAWVALAYCVFKWQMPSAIYKEACPILEYSKSWEFSRIDESSHA